MVPIQRSAARTAAKEEEVSTEGRLWPGVDNSRLVKDLRAALGVTVSEWLRLSWDDRAQLIEQFKRQEGLRP